MQLMSFTIYATQQEGGIRGDGRVGVSFENGDRTISELNQMVDCLQEVIRTAKGCPGARSGIYDTLE